MSAIARWLTSQQGLGRLTLQLHLILNDQGLTLIIDLLGELGRDSVMGSRVLHDETLVTLHSLVDNGLLDSPLAIVGPLLLGALGVLLGMGRLPPLDPVVGELLKEGGLQLGRLIDSYQLAFDPNCSAPTATTIDGRHWPMYRWLKWKVAEHTVNVGMLGATGLDA